jgi:hypothetical protein
LGGRGIPSNVVVGALESRGCFSRVIGAFAIDGSVVSFSEREEGVVSVISLIPICFYYK